MVDEKDEEKTEYIVCPKVYDEDDVLLDAIMHLPLDSVISILQSAISPV